MMAPTAMMVSHSLFIMPAGCDAVFLHSVECVAADCGAFALWEHEDFAFDALSVAVRVLFR